MSEPYENPYDTPEYQAFVESMVPHCNCEVNRPCEGVLAGGICERVKRSDFYDTYEEKGKA